MLYLAEAQSCAMMHLRARPGFMMGNCILSMTWQRSGAKLHGPCGN